MNRVTPLILLLSTSLIWSACTPSSNDNGPTPTGEQTPAPGVEKIAEQENKLESVGLKFVITEFQEEDSLVQYVSWDDEIRQAWLAAHTDEDLVLQVEELKAFLGVAKQEEEISEEDLLSLKIDLAQETLDELEQK